MCPACVLTLAFLVGGATSAGGVTALVIRKHHARTRAKNAAPAIQAGPESPGSPDVDDPYPRD
jgi:hypothetical protein